MSYPLRNQESSSQGPVAAKFSVQESLELLDGRFMAVAKGVAEDRYAFWLGSGISFGRVDGLREIVPRILEFLRFQINLAVPACRFMAALVEALNLAQLSEDEWNRTDFGKPFSDWPDSRAITDRLTHNYSKLLDIQVEGEESDYLLWNGVDIPTTFADPSIEPDAEHLCIAILILEGAASRIATSNWDGLLERAAAEMSDGHPSVAVCVKQEDLKAPAHQAWLFKFHGCAIRATENEKEYRDLLIGRQSQISGWASDPRRAALVDRLKGLIVEKPTIMMGLSAQDANIQALFAHAQATMAWQWPGERPSYVFSEDRLGADQKGMLQTVYRDSYKPETRQAIHDGALIRSFAKPLLVALALHVLCSKLQHFVKLAPSSLGADDRLELQTGLVVVRNILASLANGDLPLFVRTLVDHSSRSISLFRDGHPGGTPRPYNPITSVPLHRTGEDRGLPSSGLLEAAVALGVLGLGVQYNFWTLTGPDQSDPASGIATLVSADRATKVFLVANSQTALRLRNNGHLTDNEDVVVVYSSEIAPVSQRSPRSSPGRTGKVGPREVSISQLLIKAGSTGGLIQRFREEVSI